MKNGNSGSDEKLRIKRNLLKEEYENKIADLESYQKKLGNMYKNTEQVYHDSKNFTIDIEGDSYRFGVVGGTYFGRTSSRPDALKQFYEAGDKLGVDRFFSTGAIIAGKPNPNKVHEYDIYAMDPDEQISLFKEMYPRKRGTRNLFIVGRPERTFEKNDKINIVSEIEKARSDFTCIGGAEKDVELNFHTEYGDKSVILKLMHPKESELGRNYTISHKPQKIVASLTGGVKPDMLILGRYDVAEHIPTFRGVECIQSGCFCDQTVRMKEKHEPAHIGGWIIDCSVMPGEDGLEAEFVPMRKTFYAKEREKDLGNEYEKTVSRSRKEIMKIYDELNVLKEHDFSADVSEQIMDYGRMKRKADSLKKKQDEEFKKLGEVLHYFSEKSRTTYIEPKNGNRIKYGVISDLHYGSNECQREGIMSSVDYLDSQGVKHILVPGDAVAGYGMFGTQQFEQTHVGFDSQLDLLVDELPRKPGIMYHMIRGNHDMSYEKACGANIIKTAAAQRGDIDYVGDVIGFVDFGLRGGKTAKIMMMHPSGGSAMNLSYKTQKIVEMFAGSSNKPNTMLIGHFHKAHWLPQYMNVNAIQAGCFESLTKFMAAKPIKGHVGSWIIEEAYGDYTNDFKAQFIPLSNGDIDEDFIAATVDAF